MATDRYQHGLDKMMEYMPKGDSGAASHLKLADDLKDIAPDVTRYMVEFAFGDIYARPGLTKQEQALVTISSLVTLGTEPQLELHIDTGLTVGLSKEQITSAIIHLLPYTGFPRVLNALAIVKKVFAERDADDAPETQAG
ncbi:carboxymuconolactone decarboxylase family protein [Streptomyces sp. NPDC056817]|uniref:carboxymuconolactone decarboxylase family protein n=1 Tax=Streptomyces sp. NPDC056817 TaxID=3345950 RepID=UPI003680744E